MSAEVIRITPPRSKSERLIGLVDPVAGERPGGLFDIEFGVVSFAEGEKLHHFAGEIFVRFFFFAPNSIQPDHHRRVA
jgi:hypothetical protein